jgi:hypothetical protein
MDWKNSLGLSYRKKIHKLQAVFSLKYSLTSLVNSGTACEPESNTLGFGYSSRQACPE